MLQSEFFTKSSKFLDLENQYLLEVKNTMSDMLEAMKKLYETNDEV
jgi:hypothetical protein